MKSVNLVVDENTGELIPQNVMVSDIKAPSISIDVSNVATYHKEPSKLVKLIADQAAFATFDISTKAGRDACKAHAANIIRCISPAINESKRMAADAKKVVNQDIAFRREFENGIRELAAYHRKPLTEWEDEQDRIKQAEEMARLKIEEAKQYLVEWQDAIDYNELFDLRKAKQVEEDRQAEIEKKRLFDIAVEETAKILINSKPIIHESTTVKPVELPVATVTQHNELPKITLNDVIFLIAGKYSICFDDAKKVLIDVLLTEELK